MPRVRNGSPDGGDGGSQDEKKGAARTPKKKPAPRAKAASKAKAGAAKTPAKAKRGAKGGSQKGRTIDRLDLISRLKIGQRVVLARHQPNQVKWPDIAKAEDLTLSTAMRVYNEHVRAMQEIKEPSGEHLVDEALMRYEALIAQLSEILMTTTSESSRIGAIKAIGGFIWKELELLSATGRLPQKTNVHQQALMMTAFLARFEQLAAKFAAEAPEELVEQFFALGLEVRTEFGYDVPEVLALTAGGEDDVEDEIEVEA